MEAVGTQMLGSHLPLPTDECNILCFCFTPMSIINKYFCAFRSWVYFGESLPSHEWEGNASSKWVRLEVRSAEFMPFLWRSVCPWTTHEICGEGRRKKEVCKYKPWSSSIHKLGWYPLTSYVFLWGLNDTNHIKLFFGHKNCTPKYYISWLHSPTLPVLGERREEEGWGRRAETPIHLFLWSLSPSSRACLSVYSSVFFCILREVVSQGPPQRLVINSVRGATMWMTQQNLIFC